VLPSEGSILEQWVVEQLTRLTLFMSLGCPPPVSQQICRHAARPSERGRERASQLRLGSLASAGHRRHVHPARRCDRECVPAQWAPLCGGIAAGWCGQQPAPRLCSRGRGPGEEGNAPSGLSPLHYCLHISRVKLLTFVLLLSCVCFFTSAPTAPLRQAATEIAERMAGGVEGAPGLAPTSELVVRVCHPLCNPFLTQASSRSDHFFPLYIVRVMRVPCAVIFSQIVRVPCAGPVCSASHARAAAWRRWVGYCEHRPVRWRCWRGWCRSLYPGP
jgi:hypothetical protein